MSDAPLSTDNPITDVADPAPVDPAPPPEPPAEELIDPPAPQGAPEKYEFVPPEGQQYDTEVIGVYSKVAKELNLTQDGAQKLLDEIAPVMQSRHQAAIAEMVAGWKSASETDKEFGGDKLKENMGIANTALDKFGTPELKQLLNEDGLGMHPEVLRFLFRTGKALSQDTVVTGRQTAASSEHTSLADKLYK